MIRAILEFERSFVMYLKRGLSLWFSLIILAVTLIIWQGCSDENVPPKGKVTVAVVNGTVITKVDFDRRMGFLNQEFLRIGKTLKDAERSLLERQVLNELIGNELLYQESQKQGIEVDDRSIENGFENWRKQFPSDKEYKKALKRWNTSEDEIKFHFKRKASITTFVNNNFSDKIVISEKELRDLYDSKPQFSKQPELVRISDILIKVEPNADDSVKNDARKKIVEIKEKLKKGEDFAVLAREYSQSPSSSKVGDLNYFKRGQLGKPFDEIAFSLKPGEVSEVIETKFGYSIIKVVDRKPETTAPFEAAKKKINEYLKRTKLQGEIAKYLQELMKKAKIEVLRKNDSKDTDLTKK